MVGNYLGQICPKENDYSCIVTPFQAIQRLNAPGTTVYARGCEVSGTSTSGFNEAINAAKAADVVVLLIGIDQSIEGEDHDRTQIDLPGVQSEFAQKILALQKPTAVVLLHGGIVAIEELVPLAPAIVSAWYPGYQGGNAIADVVFGNYNPGGKLPVTWYKKDYINQVSMLDMNMSKAPGRTYKYFTGTPTWPFGYGLSYTQFHLDWKNTSKPLYTLSTLDDSFVTYTVNVTNIGKVTGDEVVQAYFKPSNDPLIIKQLFGFQRVTLLPGESKTISFNLNAQQLKTADQLGNLIVSPGAYPLLFTNGNDQTLETTVKVVGKDIVVEPFPK